MRDDVTALVPVPRHMNQERRLWLKQALGSLGEGAKYIVLANDGEIGSALNEGARMAETEFVFRLDADDLVHSQALDFLASLAWDCDITYPSLVHVDKALRVVDETRAPFFCPNRLLIWNFIGGASLIRRETALRVGFRDLPLLEDWDFYVRALRDGAHFKAVPEALYYYRDVPDSRNKSVEMTSDPEGFRDRWWKEIVGTAPEIKGTWIYQATYPPAYYRCLMPARYLGTAWDWPSFPINDDDLSFPETRGSLVVQFPGDSGRGLLMHDAMDRGMKTLVDVDDNYFVRPPGATGWTEKKRDRSSFHSREGHAQLVREAHGVIVTTDYLGSVYEKHNPDVYLCPNQIDPRDWPELKKPDDGIFRVGWFASPSHANDAQLVKRALEWAAKQDGVEVVTMGYDPGWQGIRRRHIPWTNDMGTYRLMLMSLDVGLAPVVATPWAACRSDLKAIEYAMAGALPIVSDSPPYAGFGGPCARARTAKDFLGAVKIAVSEKDDTRELAAMAREYVLDERTVLRNLWRWERALL